MKTLGVGQGVTTLANKQDQANETTRANPCTTNTIDLCVAREQGPYHYFAKGINIRGLFNAKANLK